MPIVRRTLPLLLLALGCGGSGTGGADISGDASSYGWVTLSGPTVGDGSAAVGQLRKMITVNVADAGGYQVGVGYALRTDPSSQIAYVVIPITNVDHDFDCFVQAVNLVWKDAGGQPLPTSLDFGYAAGTLGLDGGKGGPYDSCLAKGATGYLLQVEDATAMGVALYDEISSVEFSVTTAGRGASLPSFHLVPLSYTYAGSTLTVTLQSQSTTAFTVHNPGNGMYLLLDGAGLPLIWGFVGASASSGDQITPGQMLTATSDAVTFAGSGSSVAFLVAIN